MPSRSPPIPNPVAVDCPRCKIRLPPHDLVKHLWVAHRLLIEDGEARDPWQMIDGWVVQYCKEGNPELLQRCRALAARVDPELGLLRVQRFYLKHGVQVQEAKQSLLAEARVRHASVCPRCFALVPADEEPPVRPLVVSRGRLSGAGYRVEVFEHTLRSRLEIETPQGFLYGGPEPGRRWNRRGVLFLCAGLPVLLALLLACLLPFLGVHPLWAVGP